MGSGARGRTGTWHTGAGDGRRRAGVDRRSVRVGRWQNAGRAWRATSYGDKSITPLELRGYGDEAMSPRLRRAPSRSSFQAEVAERGAKPLLQFRRVVGGIHGLSLSLSLSQLSQTAGDKSSSGRAWQVARTGQRARWAVPRRALEAVRYGDKFFAYPRRPHRPTSPSTGATQSRQRFSLAGRCARCCSPLARAT